VRFETDKNWSDTAVMHIKNNQTLGKKCFVPRCSNFST